MKKRYILSVFCVYISILLCCCNRNEEQFSSKSEKIEMLYSGQIFIVQQNRVNVKLGGATIYLVKKEVLQKMISDRASYYQPAKDLKTYLADYNECVNQLDKWKTDPITEKYSIYREILSEVEASVLEGKRFFYNKDKRTCDMVSSILSLENNSNFLDDEATSSLQMWLMKYLGGTDFSNVAEQKMISNADGNFQFKMERSEKDYVLLVADSRKVFKNTEYYLWIYDVPNIESNQLILTSANQLDSGGLTTMLRGGSYGNLSQKKFNVPQLRWFKGAARKLLIILNEEKAMSERKGQLKEMKRKVRALKAEKLKNKD